MRACMHKCFSDHHGRYSLHVCKLGPIINLRGVEVMRACIFVSFKPATTSSYIMCEFYVDGWMGALCNVDVNT
jgi:hypothetical protein